MPDDTNPAAPLAAGEFPLPFGIEADSGHPLPGLTDADLAHIDVDRPEVADREDRVTRELVIADIDPNNLDEAGWCVVFAGDADPAVKRALDPLLRRREQQAGRLFAVFEGQDGYQPGDDARKWVERHGAGFSLVDPERGVPLYVLLIGSPTEIPFEVQYFLDLYWNVGRLHFDTADEYRAYADGVVDYETTGTLPRRKRAALFAVKSAGDRPTALLHDQVARPLAIGAPPVRPLAGIKGFQLESFLAADATKENLTALLSGSTTGGAPAFLFTGSHGVKFKMDDPTQRDKQGAILCQDWPGFGKVAPAQMFAASDVPDDANVHGLVHFFFACYGGGCPKNDNFGLTSGTPPRPLMPEPIVARLPQRLLTSGALASIAHVDRAWAYSFQNSRSAPQIQDMRDVMVRVLQGQRVGQATDGFNMRWAVLSAELQESQTAAPPVAPAVLANRYVARNDARNYIILGDPAVRLRVDDMAS